LEELPNEDLFTNNMHLSFKVSDKQVFKLLILFWVQQIGEVLQVIGLDYTVL
jgi:hypothetical protein